MLPHLALVGRQFLKHLRVARGILVVHQIAGGNAVEGPARQIAIAIIHELRAAGPTLNPVQEIVLVAGTARDECVSVFVVIRRGSQAIVLVEGRAGARVGKWLGLLLGAITNIVVAVGAFAVPGAFVARDQFARQPVKVVIAVVNGAGGRRVARCPGLGGAGPSAVGGHVIQIAGQRD